MFWKFVLAIATATAVGSLVGGFAIFGGAAGPGVALGLIAFGLALAVYSAGETCRLVRKQVLPQLHTQRGMAKTIRGYAQSAAAAAWFDRTLMPEIPLPSLGGWALSPETAGLIVRQLKIRRPQVVLELGSGVSTLLCAYALESNGSGRIFSIESDKHYCNRTQQLLTAHNLGHRATVIHAPLTELSLEDWSGRWYNTTFVKDLALESVDFLIVDGPPGKTNEFARFPALAVLSDTLADDCMVLLDDADREHETVIAERWTKFGWTGKYLPVGAGAIMLTRNRL